MFEKAFNTFANSRPEFSSGQIQSIGYSNLPYYYRQTGDPQNSLRVNTQKLNEMGAVAFNGALMIAGGEQTQSFVTSTNNVIRITEERYTGHIEKYHGHDSITPGKSKFNSGVDIKSLIQDSVGEKRVLKQNGLFQRTFDIGDNIGVDVKTGKQTSTVTVITKMINNEEHAWTSYPGK